MNWSGALIRHSKKIWRIEKNNWQEMLFRTITDARLKPSRHNVADDFVSEAMGAYRYLTTPSKDLAMLCALAGVDMGALVQKMQNRGSLSLTYWPPL
ncbi:hypothetical protein SAMN04488103_105297 [Gemmobacter aquatilis]|uniref:Uncharacterized protein n=1 Tax=Gemmobacter aquatilis TaxID=933059 RepID=A0A1H8HAV5_9RHOB|nr:hypothetical protein [Gemmobacter aquatilis]SEN53356.1 hypothetical protein SAMN04488103_105297 [Gemmobacter aquatilis]